MLAKKDIQQLKKKLEKGREEIEEELKKHKKLPDFGSDTGSFDEETDESQAYGNQLALSQMFKERLADIELALNKIKKGDYGVCEKCGKEISLKVLEASPESKLCQTDKQKERIKNYGKKLLKSIFRGT